jgi:hypothetical protein
MTPQFSRFAGWSAYLSVAATLIGFFFLIFFFTIGQPFGTLNDAASVLQVLFMIPVAIAFHRLLRAKASKASLAAATIGIGAMLVIAVLQALVVVNAALYPQIGNTVLTAGGGLGVWLLLANTLSRQQSIFPGRLTGLGLIAGAGYVVLVIGFWVGGQENILFIVGSLAVVIVYPIWAIWLGRILLSNQLTAKLTSA